MTLADGQTEPIDRQTALAPLEQALRAMSWGVALLATTMAVARLRLATTRTAPPSGATQARGEEHHAEPAGPSLGAQLCCSRTAMRAGRSS